MTNKKLVNNIDVLMIVTVAPIATFAAFYALALILHVVNDVKGALTRKAEDVVLVDYKFDPKKKANQYEPTHVLSLRSASGKFFEANIRQSTCQRIAKIGAHRRMEVIYHTGYISKETHVRHTEDIVMFCVI